MKNLSSGNPSALRIVPVRADLVLRSLVLLLLAIGAITAQGEANVGVAAGGDHTIFIDAEGTAWAVGQNSHGQLGVGSTMFRDAVSRVRGPEGHFTGAISAAAGAGHSLVLRSDGTVWAAGLGSSGQLGNGSSVSRSLVTQVVTSDGPLAGIQAIAAGSHHSIALSVAGEVWVWGNNSSGQLGLGSTSAQLRAVKIPGLSEIVAIAAGEQHSYAVKADGTVLAFGRNSNGQLGNTTTVSSPVPVTVQSGGLPLTDVVAVAAGLNHGVFLKSNGTAWAVGLNSSGQLGDGSSTRRTSAVAVTSPSADFADLIDVAAGDSHSVFLKSDGTAWSAGNNAFGQLGDGSYTNRNRAVMVPNLGTVQIIVGGGERTLAVRADGSVAGWGDNTFGGLAMDAAGHAGGWRLIPSLTAAIDVSAGAAHSLSLRPDGTVWSVGRNSSGQLGNGTNVDSTVPVSVLGASSPISGIVSVAAGSAHSLALDGTGTIWAWGSNANGRLGDGTTVSRNRAVAVQEATGVLQGADAARAGDGFNLALRDGVVLAWGQNNLGQLGDGSNTERRKAVEVQTASGTLSDVIAIATGSKHGVALKGDGTVWTWGQNTSGQLGLNDLTNRNRATQIPDVNDAVAIAAGSAQTYILRSTNGGSVWAVGANNAGQLADGSTTNRRTVVPVQGPDGPLTGITWIRAGSLSQHATAGGNNGISWIWGSNSHGQLGEPAPGFAVKARAVPQDLEPMALGSQSSFALSELGDWFATGSRLFGQLGDGITGLSNLALSVRGMSFALPALDSDGDGISDWLELSVGSNPDLVDADGDGIADSADAFPHDFYNGASPVLVAVGSQSRNGAPGTLLNAPVVVRVSNNGVPVGGAPVTFSFVINGLGASGSEVALSNVLTVRTDDLGRAQCFVKLPTGEGTWLLTAQAAGSTVSFQVSAEFPPNKKPPAVPVWQSPLATTASVFLRWNPSVDFFGEAINYYLIFRNDVQVATSSRLSWTDRNLTPGETYSYRVVARDKRGNVASNAPQSVTTAPQATLPTPWTAVDVGVYVLGAGSEAWQNDQLVVASGGRDIMSSHRFIYREFEGDFAISTKVDFLEATAIWAKAGLVVAGDLGPSSPRLVYAMSGERDAQIQVRTQSGGGSDAVTTPDVKTPGWIRIERTGSTWVFSASFDGERWFATGRQELALPNTVVLGLAVASSDQNRFCTALFSDVVFENRVDLDGDGLTDVEEGVLGTNPQSIDSDGDGITDFTESRIFLSNPLLADIGSVTQVQNLAATIRVAALGRWAVGNNGRLSARDQRGWVEFDISVPTPGIYRLSLDVSELTNPTGDPYHDFSFWVDGVFIDTSRVRLGFNQPGVAQVMTPFLQPGSHRVRILWDNTLTDRRIALQGLRVESFEDLGWVGTRLGRLNGLTQPTGGLVATSISPFLIEGWSRFPESVAILDGNDDELVIHPLPADSWFAELPLSAAEPTAVEVSFENEGLTAPVEVSWLPLDLLDPHSADQVLRLGDQLLMSIPGSSPERAGTISIRRSSEQTPAWEYPATGTGIAHAFEQSGEFVVTASLPASAEQPAVSRTLTVWVENSKLAPDLVLTAGTPAQWPQPLLAAEVPVQFDARIAFQELTGPSLPRVFRVGSSSTTPLYVAARTEEGGRVLDSAAVKAIKVSSSVDTSMKVVDTLPDGSEIVEMPVLVSDVVPGMSITLRIVVAGVTFDDGSLVKVLTAEDFDELGRARVRFIRNNGVSTASCYTMEVQYAP